ncbi:fasciclin domain-containing protein [Arachidicoccus sp.]|uniref:fasciclin domain-containing protein n=1 Tax=Arachidicoccus sp. TaxID=1872624 RepID=UPI003D1F98A5
MKIFKKNIAEIFWRFVRLKSIIIYFGLLFVVLLVISVTGCQKSFEKYYHDTGSASVYLYDKLKQDTNFTIFAEGLDRVGLAKYINNGGLYTVFAPTNNAFKKYFADKGYTSIENVPLDTLFKVLNFHVTNNLWYYYTLQQRYVQYHQTLFLTRGNKFLNIDVTSPDTLKVNGIPVIKSLRDISADNAVIQGIGTVLEPMDNLEVLLSSDPYFSQSTFYKLMQVLKDSSFDRFNSYDKNGDGKMDSAFYKTYDYLSSVYTSIEFRQSTASDEQGGFPVFSTILMPDNDVMNQIIAPAIAKISNDVPDKIAALSKTYVSAVLQSYFLYDTAKKFTVNDFLSLPANNYFYATNGQKIPYLNASNFERTDVLASNGIVQLIDTAFVASDLLQSALGQASMDPDLSIFMEAIQKAGLMGGWGSLSKVVTFMAPTNEAFEAAGLDIVNMSYNGVALSTNQLANIMRNHFIDQNLSTPSALTGNFSTDFNASNSLSFSNGGATLTQLYSGSPVNVAANVELPSLSHGSSNSGYLYKIDKLLVPTGY